MQTGFTNAGITSISLDRLRLSDYFKTDHHWNIDGAYQAYGEIVREIGKKEPTLKKVEVTSESKRASKHPYFGSLARKTTLAYASTGDKIEYYDGNEFTGIDVCYDKKCGQPLIDEQFIKEEGDYADRYEVFMRGNHGILSMTLKRTDRSYLSSKTPSPILYSRFLPEVRISKSLISAMSIKTLMLQNLRSKKMWMLSSFYTIRILPD